LDRRDELLLAVAERGPIHVDLHLALRGPLLHLLREDVVTGRNEALEEPDAELRPRLRGRHAVEHLETGSRSARDQRGLAKELTPRDQSCVEPLGELSKTMIHGSSLMNADERRVMLPQPWIAGKKRSRCSHDAAGVDAVVSVQVGSRARLAEMIHAERELSHAERPADERESV